MWGLSRLNGGNAGGGVQTRQYFSMPEHTKTAPPVTAAIYLPGLVDNFSNIHRISTEKRFFNPNFVKKENPNVHSRWRQENVAHLNTISEKCSSFLATNQNTKTDTRDNRQVNYLEMLPEKNRRQEVELAVEETKENTRRKKPGRKGLATKKTSRQSMSSPRKSDKGKTKNSPMHDIDKVGFDPADDSDSPVVGLCASSPKQCRFDFGDICGEIFSVASSTPPSPLCISIAAPVVISINAGAPRPGGVCRSRIPSDCGSEDSFIVFQCGPDDDADETDFGEEETDTETDDDESDTSSESSFRAAENDGGGDAFRLEVPRKKVTFADDLCQVHPMVCWSYAYQAARKGPWEEYARDRDRFKERIQRVGRVLSPVLRADHRSVIFDRRFGKGSRQHR